VSDARPETIWRAPLFVPAERPDRLAKALACGADAVIADLEDSVRADRKEAAREEAVKFAREVGGPARLVRVNDPLGELGERDLAALGDAEPAAVMVPKASAKSVRVAARAVPRVVALVETAAGLREAARIAAEEGVVALALGTVDLSAELGLAPLPEGAELLHCRSSLVVDGAVAGIPVLDGPFLDPGDELGIAAEARRARNLGFKGKLCIHPGQVAPVREAFALTGEELERAGRVLDAYEREGDGAIVVDGRMVDAAVLREARRVIAEAGAAR
jgi:citrate lyase subunit beta/citryl-CoA lyase